jgi:uncharacterized protein YggU (UPF0235/DUF167 family)
VTPKFFTPSENGATLHVRLTPKGGRDALEGMDTLANGQGVLKARVRAVPEGGNANDALIALLAKSLGIPASRVKIISGATSRHKALALEGDPAELAASLDLLARGRSLAKGRSRA